MILKNNKNKIKTIILASVCALGVSCGDSSSDDDPEATEETANPEAKEAVAALTAAQPALFMAAGTGAIQSAEMGALQLGLRLEGDEQNSDSDNNGGSEQKKSENDAKCSNKGDPWDEAENKVRQDGETYTQHKFYCKLNSGTIESPDTIPGILTQQQSIICSIAESFGVTEEDYTEAGKEHVEGDTSMMTLSEKCWPQGQPRNDDSDQPLTEAPMNSVVTKKLSEDSGWQYELSFNSEAIGIELSLKFFKSEDGAFGFNMKQPGKDDGAGSNVSITVDTTKGILLFNEIEDRNGAGGSDSVYRGLTRMRVKGKMDKDLKFTEIEEGRGYIYTSGPDFDGTNDQAHTYSVYTVDGNKDKGWQWKQFWTEQTPGTLTERQSSCTDGDKSCSDSKEIGTVSVMETYFKAAADVRAAWKTYASDGKPMCESAEASNDDVDFSSTPKSTGNLGKCD